jgi:hypothetical protein
MIELLIPCGFNILEYSWVKATIGICTLADYSVAKKRQQALVEFVLQPAYEDFQDAVHKDFKTKYTRTPLFSFQSNEASILEQHCTYYLY